MTTDGWEHATAYHWLMDQAAHGRLVVITPDLCLDDGQPAVLSIAYHHALAPTVDNDADTRALAFVHLARVAHEVIEDYLTHVNTPPG